MAPGREVCQYFKDWAVRDNIMKDVKLNHRVTSAVWNDQSAMWEIKGVDSSTGKPFSDRGDILFACNGTLNNPKFPEVPGIESFKGQLVHSARWPEGLDLRNKTVAVIGGSGATGVQLVPAVQPQCKKMVVYLRSKFWAIPGIRSRYAPSNRNFEYTDEQKEAFKERGEVAEAYATDLEDESNWWYRAVSLREPLSALRRRGTNRTVDAPREQGRRQSKNSPPPGHGEKFRGRWGGRTLPSGLRPRSTPDIARSKLRASPQGRQRRDGACRCGGLHRDGHHRLRGRDEGRRRRCLRDLISRFRAGI